MDASHSTTILISFIAALIGFTIVGVLSALKNRHNNKDYLLASSSIKPWLVALSAVATCNSGYMFIGLIGYTYIAGLQSMWIMIGFIVGDFLASLFIHRRLRTQTAKSGSLSYAGVLSSWTGKNYQILRFLAGLITIAFLSIYAAAQLNAGAKALLTLLGWNHETGAIIGAVIIVLYCFSGGIRASIWTDAAQSFVMIVAILAMVVLGINGIGGWHVLGEKLNAVSPHYLGIFPQDLAYGPALFVIGWLAAGFGVVGQPHIMVRFMAMEKPEQMRRVRFYYYSWYSVFSALCIFTGFLARLILPYAEGFDTELAMPFLAQSILPPVFIGLVLAGLFAATISTADSQIISCTASIARDLTGGKKLPFWLTKLSTIVITGFSLLISLYGSDGVFILVLMAWSAMASAFAPLLTVKALGAKPSQFLSISMMLGGLGMVILWRYWGLNGDVYEVLPGLLSGFLIFALGQGWRYIRKQS